MSPSLLAACRAATLFFERPVTPSLIKQNSKSKSVCRPRQFVMAWMYRTGKLSHTQVVRLCGRKDHSTSVNALERCDERYWDSPIYRRLMAYALWWAAEQAKAGKTGQFDG